jgi:hypothetical protein
MMYWTLDAGVVAQHYEGELILRDAQGQAISRRHPVGWTPGRRQQAQDVTVRCEDTYAGCGEQVNRGCGEQVKRRGREPELEVDEEEEEEEEHVVNVHGCTMSQQMKPARALEVGDT